MAYNVALLKSTCRAYLFQETLLKSLARKHGIQVEIKSRQLILSGLKKAVQKAEVTANDMLLRQFSETRIRRKMTQIVLEHVQWMYEDCKLMIMSPN